jgi:DNA polymerase elongation subunit (family B)
MLKLKPVSTTTSPPSRERSTEQRSDAPLRKLRLPAISHSSPSPRRLSKVNSLRDLAPRILDFDLETLAAGYADPEWVPDKITCISASWIGTDDVHTWVTGQENYWSREGRAESVLRPFYELVRRADVLTGHNIARFDIRVFNAEAMRCGVEPIRRIRVEDTMRILKAKGYKKGLDNIAVELNVPERKLQKNWAEWDLAYEDPGWREVIERCESDVRMHKLVREEMRRRNWLKPAIEWRA